MSNCSSKEIFSSLIHQHKAMSLIAKGHGKARVKGELLLTNISSTSLLIHTSIHEPSSA